MPELTLPKIYGKVLARSWPPLRYQLNMIALSLDDYPKKNKMIAL
jgi:hypothetical protein